MTVKQIVESADAKSGKRANIESSLYNMTREEIRLQVAISALQGEALAKAKGLTKYEIRDGVFIYAKNERGAVKRAKKRGLL